MIPGLTSRSNWLSQSAISWIAAYLPQSSRRRGIELAERAGAGAGLRAAAGAALPGLPPLVPLEEADGCIPGPAPVTGLILCLGVPLLTGELACALRENVSGENVSLNQKGFGCDVHS